MASSKCARFAFLAWISLSVSLVSADDKPVATYLEGLYEGMNLTVRNKGGSNIVDGGLAIGDYPSYAISDGRFVCGATLVWPDMLVSSASCFAAFSGSFVSAYIGGDKRGPGVSLSNAPEIIDVDGTIVNPANADGTGAANIMMVQLARSSQAPISPWNTNPAIPADGQALTVIGYGFTNSSNDQSFSTNLKQATVSKVGDQVCKDAYPSSPIDFTGSFCFNRGNGIPCGGDGGGPVFDDKDIIVGINTFGPASQPCGSAPHGATRISTYTDWLNNIICQFSLRRPKDPAYCCLESNCKFLGLFKGYLMKEVGATAAASAFGSCSNRCVRSPRRLIRRGWECGKCPAFS
jgi:secreted trypsin-like serine protease